MNKPVLSVEYCHVVLGKDLSAEVKSANSLISKVVQSFGADYDLHPYIMIDDLRSSEVVTQEYINNLISQLDVKPDVIFLESAFVQLAESVLDIFEHDNKHVVTTDEERWLHQIKDVYGSKTDFLLSWKKSEDTLNFSCSTLVAASYLFRLGSIDQNSVKPVYGEFKVASKLLNILPAIYMQTEVNARTIVEAYRAEEKNKITYMFY